MNREDIEGAMIIGLPALVLLVAGIAAVIRDGLPDVSVSADGFATVGRVLGWCVVAAAVLWVRHRWSTRTERKVGRLGGMRAKVHAHAGYTGSSSMLQRFIGRHEWGHVVGAQRTGMGVESVEIGDGYGYVQARRFVSVKASITFVAAGHLAVRSKRGADFDLAQIRKLARMLPDETRKADLHDALAEARRIVARDAATIRREGHHLAATGRARLP